MISDCRTWGDKDPDEFNRDRQRVFVDGIEQHQVFYVDTELGLIRTYDVLRDRKAHASSEKRWIATDFPGRHVDLAGEVLSETIRGIVTVAPFEENS